MMSKSKFLIAGSVIFGVLFFAFSFVWAQDDLVAAEIEQALAESSGLADEPEELERVVVEEPKAVPSNFGLWWRNWRERVSIALTLDPVKKAEKQLVFAEERLKLADYIVRESADPKVREKAQQMMEKAIRYMERVEERKENLIGNSNRERVAVLLRNVARHYGNREIFLEKVEDKLQPEHLEQFQQFRQRTEEGQESFLGDLKNNPVIPEEVKNKAAEAADRIKARQEERREFRIEQKEILDRIKAGKQEAKTEFENLRQEREQELEQARQEFKEAREEVVEKIKAGEAEAVEKLRELNQERQREIKEIHQGIINRAKEIRQDRQEILKEGIQQIRENRQEFRQEEKEGSQ